MAGVVHLVVDAEGLVCSNCLHRGGFPSLMWDTLKQFGYLQPPMYVGREYDELGVPRCKVTLHIAATPAHSTWAPWSVVAYGYRLADTWETVAQQALSRFCEMHPAEIAHTPAGLFPVNDLSDPHWWGRMINLQETANKNPVTVMTAVVRYMSAATNLNALKEAMANRVLDIAQGSDIKIEGLQGQLQAMQAESENQAQLLESYENDIQQRDMTITQRDETSHQAHLHIIDLENAIEERDEQLAALQLPPPVPEEEDPDEIQGESGVESGPDSPLP
ncbi:unnamed protein product [Urochloa decumbens]|uniref:Uncharacterized protein n=1 Tax=Urochloa decumbens TaxID=240449 RepID=A0ABC8Z858_9POAL